MDLTTSYPRSVKEKIAGVVMIARTTDKAKAKAHGNIGEYHYNCPMDQAVFGFLGHRSRAILGDRDECELRRGYRGLREDVRS